MESNSVCNHASDYDLFNHEYNDDDDASEHQDDDDDDDDILPNSPLIHYQHDVYPPVIFKIYSYLLPYVLIVVLLLVFPTKKYWASGRITIGHSSRCACIKEQHA